MYHTHTSSVPPSLTNPWPNGVVVYLSITMSLTGWIVPAWLYTFSADNYFIRFCKWWDNIKTTGDFLLFRPLWYCLNLGCEIKDILLIDNIWISFPCPKRKEERGIWAEMVFCLPYQKTGLIASPPCFPRFLLLRVGKTNNCWIINRKSDRDHDYRSRCFVIATLSKWGILEVIFLTRWCWL